MTLRSILTRLLLLTLALGVGEARAQPTPSAPGPFYAPNWYQGYVPTPYQWQVMWSNKIGYYSNGIPIQYGGTGATTAAGALANLGAMSSALANGRIFVGNVSNLPVAVTPSGDLTMTNAGVFTVTKTGGVSFGYFATGTSAANLTGTAPASILPLFSSVANGAVAASGGGTSNFLRADGTWAPAGGTGTVTSVALTVPGFLSVSGSPVTGTGTLAVTLGNQNANLIFAGPSSGGGAAPTFRSLVSADLPQIGNNTVLGNVSGITAGPSALTGTQVASLIPTFTSIAAGMVPASGGGSTFLRADGTFAQVDASTLTGTLAVAHGGTGVTSSTGSGSTVLSSGATMSSLTVTTAFTATGLVTNADLANSSITLNTSSTGLTVPGTISLGGTANIGMFTDNVRFGNLGLGTAAPTSRGQISMALGANNITALQIQRNTDTNPTGAFIDLQNAAAASLFKVDITGTVTTGAWNGSPIGASYGGAGTVSGILKANGSGTVSAAVSGTDYAPATSGSSILLGSSGGFASYAGTSCTNQFPRSLSAAGAATCASVANADLVNSTITLNAGASVGLTVPGAMTLGSTYTIGSTSDQVRFGRMGLNAGPSTSAGTIVMAIGTNGGTGLQILRNTDSSPTGKFIRLTNSTGASELFDVDINGNVVNGTWQATAVGTLYGGTGLTTFTGANNAIYSTSSSVLTAGTLPVAAGGTASSSASGTALDNITGFSSTGIVSRTGAGTYTFSTISALLDAVSSTQGVILYRNATSWVALSPGTSGNFLQTQGAAANPQWSAGNSGTVTSVSLTVPAFLSVAGSPVTTTGTLVVTLATQSANLVFAGPTSGSAAAPTFRSLVGADLPNPASSTLGGVQSAAAVSHQWIDSISTSGVPHLSQPAFSDVSGTVASGQLPIIGLSKGGTGADLSATGGASQVLMQVSSGATVTVAQLAFSDISGTATNGQLANSSVTLNAGAGVGLTTPGVISLGGTGSIGATTDNVRLGSLGLGVVAPSTAGMIATTLGANNVTALLVKRNTDTSPTGTFVDLQNAAASSLFKIDINGNVVSGAWQATKVGLAYGGTNTDLSATGGASQVLKQTSVGGNITVAQLAFSDLSGSLTSGQLPSLTSTDLWVGNGSNVATAVTISGDATLSNAGALTVTKTSGVAFSAAATTAIGTSGAVIPLLNGANTWSATQTITSASANSLAVGPNGATTPVFNVDSSAASAVAGLSVKGAGTGGTVLIATTDSGSNSSLTINAKGNGTIGIGTLSTGNITVGNSLSSTTSVIGATSILQDLTGQHNITITSASGVVVTTGSRGMPVTSTGANALAVGLSGATNPVFNVDNSTASAVAGLNIKGAVAAGTVAVSVISSGSNASLTIDAKGTGTIGIGDLSTGAVTITPATTIVGALTLSAASNLGTPSALTLTNATGLPATALTGSTLASGVTASSLTSVGTLTGGATGAGFTVALTTSIVTGNLPAANETAAANYGQTSAMVCDGSTDDRGHLNTALSAYANSNVVTISPGTGGDGSCFIGSSITVTKQLVFLPGAKLKLKDNTVTVTLSYVPVASPQQLIFENATGSNGVVLFNNATYWADGQVVYPEWWGAIADRGTTDNGPAVQAAANALVRGGTIQFGTGYYSFVCASADAVTVTTDGVNLKGSGANVTYVEPKTNCAHNIFTINPTNTSGYIRDMQFFGADIGAPYAGHTWGAIYCQHCGLTDYSHLTLYGGAYLMKADYLLSSTIYDVEAQGAATGCILLDGGTPDASGGQHVSFVDIDNVRCFNIGTQAQFTATISNGSGGAGNTLNVTAIAFGTVEVNEVVYCSTCSPNGVKITALGTGTGGTGTYTVNGTAQNTASTTMYSASGNGVVIDSGASEISIRRFGEGGFINGILIQNSNASTGGHRPEAIRIFDGTNLSQNTFTGLNAQYVWTVEFYNSSANGTLAGPGILLGTVPAVYTAGISGTALTVNSVVSGALAVGQPVNCNGCAAGTVLVSGSGTSWVVNNSQTVGSSTSMNSSSVDRFEMGSGESSGNLAENILIQGACNVQLNNISSVGAGAQASNTFPAVHATKDACGTLQLTSSVLGGVLVGNFHNLQSYALTLDSGSYANEYVQGQLMTGRINVQLNMMQGNQSGAVNNLGTTPTGAQLNLGANANNNLE